MDLPSDMTKLIASYLKPKPYSKMSSEELEKEYSQGNWVVLAIITLRA